MSQSFTIYLPAVLRASPASQSTAVMRPAGGVGTEASACNQVVNAGNVPSTASDLMGGQLDAIENGAKWIPACAGMAVAAIIHKP
jgi:hypothetical protein